jgi:hypothetical protein
MSSTLTSEFLLVLGLVVSAVTGAAFWALLPRGGKKHRFVDTELEPYISVALCAGVALSFTLIVSSLINLFGGA